MTNSVVNASSLIPSQLPEYIREDPGYQNFVIFLQSYYEWLEQQNNVLDRSKNILNYKDVDNTSSEFINYFVTEFLHNFPEDVLISKSKAVKLAKELYQSKGTPSSYKLLFRILYNSDFDYYLTKDSVFRASDGQWYTPKSIRINSVDPNFLKVDNYRLFGEISKTIATIENSVLAGNKTEIFISDITRLFQSGEFVRVVDINNQDVLFDGKVLRGKIVGQINKVSIDPKNRGLLYEVGDPVILYGGISSDNGIEAIAEVGSVTEGSIQNITLLSGGYGYTQYPNSIISITGSPTANAVIGSLDPSSNTVSNVTLFTIDTLNTTKSTGTGLIRNVTIGAPQYYLPNNPNANANTSLKNSLTFNSFYAYPISSVLLLNGGGGFKQVPQVSAISRIPDNSSDTANSYAYIKNLGILAPIKISNGGTGYIANDRIVFSGGSGYGAFANVINVSATGAITEVRYVTGPDSYPLGGMGYRSSGLPALTVNSSNVQASNASLFVPGILGEGATFDVSIDKVGAISKINVLNPGEDYTSSPLVSLKVQDIVVSNVSFLPSKGDMVYQGSNVNVATYMATVNSISLLQGYADPLESIYNLRVFNYSSRFEDQKPLVANGIIHVANNYFINMVMANTQFSPEYDTNGVRTYGDAKANASASFLNGLVISEGQYISERGQPSSYSVLQSEVFNDFTYQITVEKEIERYRSILLNLLHPTGMKVIGRYSLRSNTQQYSTHVVESLYTGLPLDHYTGYPASGIEMVANFDNMSNNIIKFNNLAGSNIANFIFENTSLIQITTGRGPNVKSEVISVNGYANTVTIKDNVWLTYANVAVISANANTNFINITSVTNSYNIINGGIYSNTQYPMMDIIASGDTVSIANNTNKTVSYVDYVGGKIYLTSNTTSNAISYLSVSRTLTANDASVIIYGPVGIEYVPELTTEDGLSLTTEDGKILILG